MSHSPDDLNATPQSVTNYKNAWSAVYTLIDQGYSWSGNERNCCFLNTGDTRFADISAASGLDLPDDGRAVAVVDWDLDGRLDLWIANRTSPRVRLLRNNTSGDHHYLAVRLRGVTSNRDAIGARAELELPSGKLIRTLHAGDGFLAQSSKWIHFGLGKNAELGRLVVRWPGGEAETFTGLSVDRRYTITQATGTEETGTEETGKGASGKAELWSAPRGVVSLAAGPVMSPQKSETVRTWIVGRVPLPEAEYVTFDGRATSLDSHRGTPIVVNLWSSTCGPCLSELSSWSKSHAQLERSGVKIIALSVDALTKSSGDAKGHDRSLVEKSRFPFLTGRATGELVNALEIMHRAYIDRQQPLPAPSSFLLDEAGNLAAIYKGPVSVDVLIADIRLLQESPEIQRIRALPQDGLWATDPFAPNPRPILAKFVQVGQKRQARAYIRRYLQRVDEGTIPDSVGKRERRLKVDLIHLLGALHLDERQFDEAIGAFAKLFDSARADVEMHAKVGRQLLSLDLVDAGILHLAHALKLRPNDAQLQYNIALAHIARKQYDVAIAELQKLLVRLPKNVDLRTHLADCHAKLGRFDEAIRLIQQTLDRVDPESETTSRLLERLELYEAGTTIQNTK